MFIGFKKEKFTNSAQIEIFIEKFENPTVKLNLDPDIEVFLDHLIDLGYDLHETTNNVEDYIALKDVLESDKKEGFEIPINKIEKLNLVEAHRPQKGKLVFSSLLKLSKEQNI